MRKPRSHLQLPQTTPRKPQEPKRTFFWAQNGLKMANNDQKPSKYAFLEIFCAIFKAKKSARRVRTPRNHLKLPQSTPRKPQKPRRTFFRPKTASKWPTTTKSRQNTPFWRYFALFLAQKSARRVRTPRTQFKLAQSTHRKLLKPRCTFISAQNGIKMAKNDQNPSKYALF